jgi:hypothetical protein
MSVFQVKLNNNSQGRLDLDPSTNTSETYGALGTPFTTSKKRSIYVAGPNRSYRKLNDGDTFTDCNYWKRFTSDVMGAEHSFISVVTDDGSIYSDVAEENTFSVGATEVLTTALADTVVDFVTDHGGAAKFLMVQNLDASIKITGELNGDTNITFTIAAGETMMFNQGDMVITMLRLKGASGTPSASYIASIKSVCNS